MNSTEQNHRQLNTRAKAVETLSDAVLEHSRREGGVAVKEREKLVNVMNLILT
jgi:hypothetical protein